MGSGWFVCLFLLHRVVMWWWSVYFDSIRCPAWLGYSYLSLFLARARARASVSASLRSNDDGRRRMNFFSERTEREERSSLTRRGRLGLSNNVTTIGSRAGERWKLHCRDSRDGHNVHPLQLVRECRLRSPPDSLSEGAAPPRRRGKVGSSDYSPRRGGPQ